MRTVNFTLRLPKSLDALVAQAASAQSQSKHQFVIDALWAAVTPASDLDPNLVIGFVELTGGEVATDVDCLECGQPLERPHIGFIVGSVRPLPFGPICWRCASTE
jgi:hypothetical protein